jgi:HAD superfamily hydrolase (TIGR01509 family)
MSESTRPVAVVFDLDGLMFNTEQMYEEVGEELLRRRGKKMTQELLDEMTGRPSPAALQIMIDWHGLGDAVADLEADTDALFEEMLQTRLAPMPGLFDLVVDLERAGVPKGIATSSRRLLADQVLGRFDLAPRFQFVLSAEDVVRGKPHPEIYLTAARRFGVEPSRMLVLEDSGIGCRAAVAAGAFAVAVPGEHSRGHDFSGAAFVADSLADRRIRQALGL